MQGKKEFTPQLFYELSLDRLVPPDNYYRIIKRSELYGLIVEITPL